ncbi:MAG: hypothetical protein JWO31_895 [Phycisphaerales bacterium]|nr:hypothetical protein [Phycisphaerales bacterium]
MTTRATLLDIAKANGSDAVVGLIDETTKAHPELSLGAARTINGLNYKTLVRTGLFTGSTFRDANQGVTAGKSTFENRLVETFIMEPRFEVDKAVADAYEDGAPAFLAMEAAGVMEKAMIDLSAQFYYGRNPTFGNASGFPGLIDAYDPLNNVVDAGGTTANTGSSVWLVKFGPQDVQWVWGQGGELALGDPRIQDLYDAYNKPFTGYVQTLLARPGLQVGSYRGLVRIKKLTEDNGKGLTDALIAAALAKFQVGAKPDMILMNRRSLSQLQASRSLSVTIFAGPTTPGGGIGAVAALPDSAFGIPIQVTDAIANDEPLTL